MQYSNPWILSEIKRLTESIARKNHFQKHEIEDLVQNVYVKFWKYRDKIIKDGNFIKDGDFPGYLVACIKSVIAESKKDHVKHTNYLKYREYAKRNNSKYPSEETSKKTSEKTFPDIYVADHRSCYGDMSVSSDVPDPIEEIEAEQILFKFHDVCSRMPKGLRKDVCRLCLSGMTDEGTNQGKDIAAKLNLDQKPVSQALSEVRKRLKSEYKALKAY